MIHDLELEECLPGRPESGDYSGLDLFGLVAPHAKLSHTNLTGTIFNGADLVGADFTCSLLDTCDFAHANLVDAGLVWATARNAIFADANMRLSRGNSCDFEGANFMGASLQGANFYGAKLVGANFTGANLSPFHYYQKHTRTSLESTNLLGACFNEAMLTEVALWWATLRDPEGKQFSADFTQAYRAESIAVEGEELAWILMSIQHAAAMERLKEKLQNQEWEGMEIP